MAPFPLAPDTAGRENSAVASPPHRRVPRGSGMHALPMALPRVSVMIPNLDGARHLAGTVRSALAQSCRDLVVRVIDNGSTDDSATVCAAIGDPRLTFEPQSERVSMADNWNRAARMADTEFVALLHNDDRWRPTFVEKMVAALDAEPEADAAFCGIAVIDTDDRVVVPWIHRHRHNRPGRTSARDRDELLVRNTLLAPCWLARRRLFDEASWDPSLHWAPDWDFWLRAFDASPDRFTRVVEVLCEYRNHAASGTFRPELVRRRLAEESAIVERSIARRATSPAVAQAARDALLQRQVAVMLQMGFVGHGALALELARDAVRLAGLGGVLRALGVSVQQLGDPAWRAAIGEHVARTLSIWR